MLYILVTSTLGKGWEVVGFSKSGKLGRLLEGGGAADVGWAWDCDWSPPEPGGGGVFMLRSRCKEWEFNLAECCRPEFSFLRFRSTSPDL